MEEESDFTAMRGAKCTAGLAEPRGCAAGAAGTGVGWGECLRQVSIPSFFFFLLMRVPF